MQKKLIKSIVAVLMMVMLVGSTAFASASRWTYISSTSANITFGGGQAHMSAYVSGYSSVTDIVASAKLEVKEGGSYRTLVTFNNIHSDSSDPTTLMFSKDWLADQGKTYRWTVYATVYAGSASESTTMQTEGTYY